jgi:UDP-N-acetyl-D-mannosaminuronate dehydrogenase
MNRRIAVVGLGYVGLPVAVAFGRRFEPVPADMKSLHDRAAAGAAGLTVLRL